MDFIILVAASMIAMAMKEMIVPPEADGWRVDRFLQKYFPQLTPRGIRQVFARRDVKINGIRSGQEKTVRNADRLRVYYMQDDADDDPLTVVYEDDDILLINKRSGISVEKDSGGGLSLTDLCRLHVSSGNPDDPFPQPVHRLDNKTCGLVLFAKNENALTVLLDVFKTRALDKYYICLVKGYMKPPSATCRAWLSKDSEIAKVTVSDLPQNGSREIITAYETLESGPISRLRIHLITGRTHQIRAHMSSLGHPLLGDDIYGDRAFNREHKCRQLKLCAAELTLETNGRLPQLDGKYFSIVPPF